MTPPAQRRIKLSLSPVPKARRTNANPRREGEAWLTKNRSALEACNEHVEKHGVFSDGLRSF